MAYCTTRDLKDVFPAIDEFDTKTALYGFVLHSSNLYRADNVGLVTQLFANGKNLGAGQSSVSDVNANDKWHYDDSNDVDGFQSFVSRLIDGDDNFDAIMNNVREQLEKEEIIKPAADMAVKTLKSLDNYKATVNPEEKEITVTWKKPNKISTDLREFKQFSAEDQDIIKKLWSREYRDSLANILNNLRKKFNFPLKNIVLSTERQRLSPELDGVYGIMDFDLLYFSDREMMIAARMLEEMNKQSYNQSLRQTSAYEYYDLLKSAEKGEPPFSKKTNESKKVTDKTLMENWKRYLGK